MPHIRTLTSERFRRLSREGAWIVLGQTAAILGSLVGVRLLTELLDPIAYGELALGMTVATLVNQTMLGPLSNGITRFYAPARESNEIGAYLGATRWLVLSATAVMVLLSVFAFSGLFLVGRSEWIGVAIPALIFAILSGYNSILNGIQSAARQRPIVALHQGIESWLRFLIAAGLMVWLGATSAVAMVGYVVATVLVLGSQCVYFRKIAPERLHATDKEKTWEVRIWKYSWPFATWGVFTWAQQVSDRWALELFATTQEVGCYAVLFQLGYYPISMATGMATQFFAPIFYQRAGDAIDSRRNANVHSLSWRLTGLALGVTCLAFLLASLFHVRIFQVLAAKEFLIVSYLLPWMLLAGGLFAAGQTIALGLMSQMKTRTMVAAKIVTALLGTIFNFAGARWYGTTGVVIASVLFSVLSFLWMLLLSKKAQASGRTAESGIQT